MMVTIVVMFALCWTPIQLFNLMTWILNDYFTTKTLSHINVYVSLFFVCHFFAMAHSAVNPIIYCFMSYNFKVKVKVKVNCKSSIQLTNSF